jgi:sulfur-carrier protein adenylyltransferase/sulfurtransferase
MNARILTLAVTLLLGVVIAMVPENTTKRYKLTASDMITEVRDGSEIISPEDLAHWIITKDPSIQIIDVRSPDEFATYHLTNAFNIPIADILNDDYVDILDQGVKMNVFYSNGTMYSHQAWMVLRQLGYENNYVLQGGLNYWFESILSPKAPSIYSSDEEIAKYDFKKGASEYFGGGGAEIQATAPATNTNKPVIKRKKAKKAPAGGC